MYCLGRFDQPGSADAGARGLHMTWRAERETTLHVYASANESQHHSGEIREMQGRFTMQVDHKREAMASGYVHSLPRQGQGVTKIPNISLSRAPEEHTTKHGLRKHCHSHRPLSPSFSLPALTTSDSLLGDSRPRGLERRLSLNRPRHPYNHLPL